MTTWAEGTQPQDRTDLERVESRCFDMRTMDTVKYVYYRIKGHCQICDRKLNVKGDARSVDCGGDCRQCMAEAGDPDCAKSLHDAGLPVPPDARGDPDPEWWRKTLNDDR
jgi:hypothetical protein